MYKHVSTTKYVTMQNGPCQCYIPVIREDNKVQSICLFYNSIMHFVFKL